MMDRFCVISNDGKLAVDFIWNEDRYAQQISVDGSIIGHSVEGDANCDWPPSPPIQQLSAERIEDQNMILGVGGAGRSHWSISARACGDDASAIRFDLACRCKETPASLGSKYQLGSGLILQVIDGRAAQDDQGDSALASSTDGQTSQWSYLLKFNAAS